LAARAQTPGDDRSQSGSAIVAEARGRLAKLLHVQPADLAFVPNTTHGLNICTHGMAWREGDNVVVPEREFPSVQYALAHLPKLGVEVRCVEWQDCGPTVEQMMAQVDGRTRAVIGSAIAWDTGYRMDLETLGERCAQTGCLLIVDGIHAVGAEPLHLRTLRVSAFAFHGYKWLMSGFGLGALYVSPDALNHIQPSFVGPLGVAADVSHGVGVQAPLHWHEGAQRFATGNENVTGAAALNASLSLIEEVGDEHIQAHNHALADLLADGLKHHLPHCHLLRSSEPRHQSAIVVFSLGDAKADAALVDKLAAQSIIVAHRPRGIRVSPHLFNSVEDIDVLLAALSG
jgi:selenocysteine lyase/cysteine desulfurase